MAQATERLQLEEHVEPSMHKEHTATLRQRITALENSRTFYLAAGRKLESLRSSLQALQGMVARMTADPELHLEQPRSTREELLAAFRPRVDAVKIYLLYAARRLTRCKLDSREKLRREEIEPGQYPDYALPIHEAYKAALRQEIAALETLESALYVVTFRFVQLEFAIRMWPEWEDLEP